MENNFHYATQKTYKTRTINESKVDQWEIFIRSMAYHCQQPRSLNPEELPTNIFAIFKNGGKRCAEDCEYVTALVLDFDNKNGNLSSKTIIESLRNYTFFTYHTKRSATGRPRLRIILPLSNRIPADIWPQTYQRLIRQLGLPPEVSNAGSIPSQAWLLPPGDCWFDYSSGEWLSPNQGNASENEVDEEYASFDKEMIHAESESIAFKAKELALLPPAICDQKTREVAKELRIGLRTLQREVKSIRNETLIKKAKQDSLWHDDFDPPTELEVRKDNLPATAQDVAKVLANDSKVFLRAKPTRMIYDEQKGRHEPKLMTSEDVVKVVHENIQPWQLYALSNGLNEKRNITLPRRVGQFYLDQKDYGLRLLNGVSSTPLLSNDGGIRIVKGYDPLTKNWCENIPSIKVPYTPTKEQAENALLFVRQIFRTFPFADSEKVFNHELSVEVIDVNKPPGKDESALLVALSTVICRPSLDFAPGLKISSPPHSGEGIGMSLLVRGICAIATGAYPSAISSGGTNEEFNKRITEELINASPVIFLNKLNSMTFRSNLIANILTEQRIAVKKLRQSEIFQLNSTAFIAIAGNDLALSADLIRMFMTVQLDAKLEDPECRPFKGDFLSQILAQREELLTAILTIWRWGRQNHEELKTGKTLGGFEQWGQWCRDPLLSLGCADPVDISLALKTDDPDRRFIADLFNQWWEKHQDTPIPVAELDMALKRIVDPQDRSRQYLAAHVRKLENTHMAGFVLTRSDSSRWGADIYQLRKVNSEKIQDNPANT